MTATLDVNTLRQRAAAFAKEFSKSTYEMGEAQDFIRGLSHIFELNHRRAVRFEDRVKKLGGKSGRIDGLFPDPLLLLQLFGYYLPELLLLTLAVTQKKLSAWLEAS
jgi:hypothetical protein